MDVKTLKALGMDYRAGKLSLQAIGTKYGITRQTVAKIGNKQGWERTPQVPSAKAIPSAVLEQGDADPKGSGDNHADLNEVLSIGISKLKARLKAIKGSTASASELVQLSQAAKTLSASVLELQRIAPASKDAPASGYRSKGEIRGEELGKVTSKFAPRSAPKLAIDNSGGSR